MQHHEDDGEGAQGVEPVVAGSGERGMHREAMMPCAFNTRQCLPLK
jgi:hypothetical protein